MKLVVNMGSGSGMDEGERMAQRLKVEDLATLMGGVIITDANACKDGI